MKKTDILNNKIIDSWKDLENLIHEWKIKEERIVFTNGCFDVLHSGHVEYLCKAAEIGDKLIIGINTDSSVRKLKGEGRPVNNQIARAKILASLFFVDAVCFFDQDTPLDLIKIVMPDVLVKGGDYKPEEIVGYKEVTSTGGSVLCLDFVEGYSSSDIIRKMKNSQ
jgi:D-glycero-beta-D-manno-heptose 1-phosphate adenylyltransferase